MTPETIEEGASLTVPVEAVGSVVMAKLRVPQAPSMPVERLDALLDRAHDHRLVLVVAPAGSGKSTLLARFAARARAAVGWYRAEAWDREEASLLRHLEAALLPQLAGGASGWQTVADAANALDAWRGGPVLLLIDDLHTLEGTPAESALGRLVDYAPATLTIVAASRVPPRLNLPRLRVSGSLAEISGDDLRFRSWEVERLFRDFYGEPLPPEELARLARRTEGWAAGLQLFHLATRGRPPDERRRLLAALGPSSRLMRDYLTRNVIDQLPPDLRRFLVETSVLGRLSAPLCDRFLGRTGSGEMLRELERRNLFTQALADDGIYRYHEVLRSYLQGVLLEEVGERQARERYGRAGQLLVETDALPEALEAYCRAEDWATAQALLGRDGVQAADRSSAWLDALPSTVLRHDPWLLLASARRLRAEGQFVDAMRRYQEAEAAFAGTESAHVCRDEAQVISAWLEPGRTMPRGDWPSLLRAALLKEPLAVARELADDGRGAHRLVGGLAALLGGEVHQAQARLQAVADGEDAGPIERAVANCANGIAAQLAGQTQAPHLLEGAVASAEGLGLEWLARLGRSGLALGGSEEMLNEAGGVAAACDSAGDRWGAALARFFRAWGAIAAEQEPDDLDWLIREFRALGAPVLEAWARGLNALSLARAGAPDAVEAARSAEANARSAGVRAAPLFSYLALAECLTDDTTEYLDLAHAIARETGLAIAARQPPPPPSQRGVRLDVIRSGAAASNGSPWINGATAEPAPLRMRLFGYFDLELAGVPLELSTVRPRVRSLLRLLSLHADLPVHHEAIEAALWPDASSVVASRNLHVAVAALRRTLEPTAARSGFRLVRREGDAYRLVVPPGGEVDVLRFEAALEGGRACRERGDAVGAQHFFAIALEEYRGELLPEEGPAEWVAERRELLRLAAVEAAQGLAELLLGEGRAAEAARVCAHGLGIERYHDPLWRLLIEARDMAGDQGAASKARLNYEQMLTELGVKSATSSPVRASM